MDTYISDYFTSGNNTAVELNIEDGATAVEEIIAMPSVGGGKCFKLTKQHEHFNQSVGMASGNDLVAESASAGHTTMPPLGQAMMAGTLPASAHQNHSASDMDGDNDEIAATYEA